MSWLFNFFSGCNSYLYNIRHEFKQMIEDIENISDDNFDDNETEATVNIEENISVVNKNNFVLVKFVNNSLDNNNNNHVEFLVSQDGVIFSFIPSKVIEEVKLTWFDEDKPKYILFEYLSKLSSDRKVFHEPDYFVNRIKKVYFRYVNKQIVPYRYSVKNSVKMV